MLKVMEVLEESVEVGHVGRGSGQTSESADVPHRTCEVLDAIGNIDD